MAPPIVPAPEDIAFVEDRLLAAADGRPVAALLLGMTRGLATLRWPAGSALFAAEWSAAMIRRFWPTGGMPAGASAVRADWRELPFATSSFDFAAGDGCYSALASCGDIALVGRELGRVLRPGGLLSIRCVVRPERGLSVSDVFEELRAGRIANVY